MTMTDVFYATGDFFQWSFKIIKGLGNGPNIFFWLLIGALMLIWLRMQGNFNKEAKEKNTLK